MQSEWPDELEPLIAEFKAEHPWLWRRTMARTWLDRQIGRWLPWLCRHRTSEGPIDGPMTCLDCGREVPE